MERIDVITINDMLEKMFISSTIKKKRKDIHDNAKCQI